MDKNIIEYKKKILIYNNIQFEETSKFNKILLNINIEVILEYKNKFNDIIEFERLYQLYCFDKEFRNILFNILGTIEESIKNKICNYFIEAYGEFGYLDINNYSTKSKYKTKDGTSFFDIMINHILEVKNKTKKYKDVDIKDLNLNQAIILMSFGNISKMYNMLNIKIQKKIARSYSIPYILLNDWLMGLSILRNKCFHHTMILGEKTGIIISFNKNKYKGNIPNTYMRYFYAIKDLAPKEWNCFRNDLKKIIDKYNITDDMIGIIYSEIFKK